MLSLADITECMALYEQTVARLAERWARHDAGDEPFDAKDAMELTDRLITACEGAVAHIDLLEEALKKSGRRLPGSLARSRDTMNNASVKWRRSCENMTACGGDETVTEH